MDIKQETIEMLRTIKLNSHSNGEKAVLIEDVNNESFLWVINQAISLIKDNKQDWRDC